MKMTTGTKVLLGVGALVVVYLLVKNHQAGSTALPGGLPDQPTFLPVNISPVLTVQPITGAGVSDGPAFQPLQLTFN